MDVDRLDDPLLEGLDAEAALVGDSVHHDREGVPLAVFGLEVAAEATDTFDEPALAKDASAEVGAVEAVVEGAVDARHRQAVDERLVVLTEEVVAEHADQGVRTDHVVLGKAAAVV